MPFKDFTNSGAGSPPGISGTPPGGTPPSGGSSGGFGGAGFGFGPVDAQELIINYNEKFKDADPILHREEVTEQILSILIGLTKPNPLLIGAAGTGKTKIIEDIARMLANNDPLIPSELKDYTIYELPLSNIVAGSSFVGQVEEKIQSVLQMMSDPGNKAILFIDEIHLLITGQSTYEKIAQILKPALSRGDMKTIGATTIQEANKLTEDPAFNRRFTRVIVDELNQQQTLEILQALRPQFLKNYNFKVSFDDDILESVITLADMYRRAGSHRPDTAITLLDRAAGATLTSHLARLQLAKDDPTVYQALQSTGILPITETQIRKTAMVLMTGNSIKPSIDFETLKVNLSHLKGQDDVIESILKILKRYDLGIHHSQKENRPLVMLFAGSSGVGKTEITKQIAKTLTRVKPITLNMTEYHSSADINRIIGSPAGYVGSESSAELPFDKLESNPYQVILLDEFEKGHPSVQALFMGAFEEGLITTAKGRDIDFSKAIVIATTNAGFKSGSDTIGFQTSSSNKNKSDVAERLKPYFLPELLGRIDLILDFNVLSKDVYRDILQSSYKDEIGALKTRDRRFSKLKDEIDEAELERLCNETYVEAFGARPARQAIMDYIAEQV